MPTLRQDVAAYLLDAVRERRMMGCFMPVYPSVRHHATYGEHLDALSRGLARQGRAIGRQRRQQMHALLGMILKDMDAADGRTFQQRCEQMLSDVPRGSTGESLWAKRSHVFKQVWDLPA